MTYPKPQSCRTCGGRHRPTTSDCTRCGQHLYRVQNRLGVVFLVATYTGRVSCP